MIKKIFFGILSGALLFCADELYAQNQTAIDSLNKLLKENISDKSRTKVYINLASEFLDSSPSTAIQFCKQSLELSKKINFDEGIGEATGWLAYLNEQQGNIQLAIDYYNQSLVCAKKTGSEKSVATIYSNLAAIYKDQGNIEDARSYNEKSLEIRVKLNDKDGIATSYNNLGLLYFNQGKIPEALDYYFKALHIEEEIKNSDGISTVLGNIASVYKAQGDYDNAFEYYRKGLAIVQKSNDKYGIGYALTGIGNLFYETRQLDSALIYHRQALGTREEIDDKQGTAYSLKNIGNIYSEQKKDSDAIIVLQKSLTLFKEVGDKWGTAVATALLGKIFLTVGQTIEAETMLNQSLLLSKELGYPADISNAAEGLQNVYRKKNLWKEALLMNDLFVQMRDSVQNDRSRKATLKTQFKYEYEKKEALLKKDQEKKDIRQRTIRNSIAGVLAGTLIFLVVVYRQRNKISNARKRSDELLLNILPAEVAEELKEKGSADAKHFDQVTVMFTDFKGFTQISEKLSPAELVAEIDTCFKAFDQIITKHNIEKIKTIGDAYMCAGGLPVANKTHAEDVVKAALEIQKFMHEHLQMRKAEGKEVFEIRIGIHTGPVVAGIVGVKKFAYDIWGDTVNIASRMESSGEAGKVNISGTTYELVKHKFSCTHRGKIEAKNKGQIDMYYVES